MRSRILGGALTACALATSLAAHAETSIGVNVSLGAPPPPVVVYRTEPRTVVVPGATVYVVDDDACDYDFFRYGSSWYIYRGGYWYRARSYRGPFTWIEVGRVPHTILTVPASHWKHHPHGGPPGQLRKQQVVMVKERGRGRGRH